MQINNAVNSAALFMELNNEFQAAFNEVSPASTPLYKVRKSAARYENYSFLDHIVGFYKWEKYKDLIYRNVKQQEYVVENERWGNGIQVDEDDIADNMVNNYKDQASAMGRVAKLLPDERIAELLEGAFTTCKTYDGQPWLGTHTILGTTIVNATTDVFSATSFQTAIQTMAGWKVKPDDFSKARPLNAGSSLVLVHGPNLIGAVKDVLEVDLISGGASNKWKGFAQPLRFDYITDDSWYILNVSGGIKPIVLQEREAVTFKSFSSNDSKENFDNQSWTYGAKWRGTALPTAFWYAYGSTGVGGS